MPVHDLPYADDPFAGRLVTALRQQPDSPAIASYRGRGDIRWVTRGALLEQALAVAAGLQAAGVARFEPCVLAPLDEGEPEAAAMFLGCILAGCPPLTIPAIDGSLTAGPEVLQRALSITNARALLVATIDPDKIGLAKILTAMADTPADLLSLADLSTGHGQLTLPAATRHVETCRAMQLTSGTTGANRVCMWGAAPIDAAVAGIATALDLRPGDRFFSWSGLHHTLGALNTLLVGLFRGVPAIFMSPRNFAADPALWLHGLQEARATITSASNFAYKLVADTIGPEDLEGLTLDHVRGIWNTGERVAEHSYRAFYECLRATGLREGALCANYGLAESTGGATYAAHDASRLIYETVDRDTLEQRGIALPLDTNAKAGETDRIATPRNAVIASVGAPWPGSSVIIHDETGSPLPDGAVGEIMLDTPARFNGYYNDAEATAAVFDGDLLRTGDLGYTRARQLFWIGRKQERLTVRGRKLDPSEFLPILDNAAGLRPGAFVAFGIDDDASGTERVIIVVELAQSTGDATAAAREVRRVIARGLGIAVDDVVVAAPDTLVTTISGKRRHRYYKQLYLTDQLAALR
ncbi:MAG: AMP-binding protein, partial [Alphaproteobacteria bacterium]